MTAAVTPSLPVPFFDLGPYHARLRGELQAALTRVVERGAFILGDEVRALEAEVARDLGVAAAVGVSSGTDALVCALSSLGMGPGCRVVTTPFTFFATVGAILRVGAKPVFCDIDPETLNWSSASLVHAPVAEAAIAVHLFGRPTPCAAVRAALPNTALVEDAAQAFGARDGQHRVGSGGALGCFSFFPTKPLGALGDGGMVVTSDQELAERCRRLRAHGASAKYVHDVPLGGNYRLDELQAAVLRLKLPHCEARLAQRRWLAARYSEALAEVSELQLPPPAAPGEHAWSVYSVRVLGERQRLETALASSGIQSMRYYPLPLHLQPALRSFGYARGDFPHAERAAEECLALPLHPDLAEAQQDAVIAAVRRCFGYAP